MERRIRYKKAQYASAVDQYNNEVKHNDTGRNNVSENHLSGGYYQRTVL